MRAFSLGTFSHQSKYCGTRRFGETQKTLFAINGRARGGRKMARGVGVEAAAVSIWRRVTGGGSARGSACRIGALRECSRGQRGARHRNSENKCKCGLIDHDPSPMFRSKQRNHAVLFGDREMGSRQVILNYIIFHHFIPEDLVIDVIRAVFDQALVQEASTGARLRPVSPT
jgi:hypothetical protein